MNQSSFLAKTQHQSATNNGHKKICKNSEVSSPKADCIKDYEVVNLEQNNYSNSFFLKDRSLNSLKYNTFLKAPFLKTVSQLESYDIAVLGIPYASNSDRKAGKQFGPQGIRYISSYNFKQEIGIDLCQKIKICDLGDLNFLTQKNTSSCQDINQKLVQIFNANVFPIILGGDRSIVFSETTGINKYLKQSKIGIIHFDSQIGLQKLERDKNLDVDSCYWSNDFKKNFANNFIQLGVSDSQISAQKSKLARKNLDSNILTVEKIAEIGLNAAADLTLEKALNNSDRLYISFDISCISGSSSGDKSLLPRELLYLLNQIIKQAPVCGLEVVGVSPPNEIGNIEAMMATRIIYETIGNLINAQQLPRRISDQ